MFYQWFEPYKPVSVIDTVINYGIANLYLSKDVRDIVTKPSPHYQRNEDSEIDFRAIKDIEQHCE